MISEIKPEVAGHSETDALFRVGTLNDASFDSRSVRVPISMLTVPVP